MDTKRLYLAFRARFPLTSAREALRVARLGARPRLPTEPYVAQRIDGNFGRWWPTEYRRDPRTPIFGAWLTDSRGRRTSERWCEDTVDAGLRFVGFADELAPRSIQHKGWYTHPYDSGEVYRGAVWQLPARNGECLYVAGFVDPYNEGAALIDFDTIRGEPDNDDIKAKAAYRADAIARIHAEHEREYQEKWEAARRVRDLLEDICDARRQHTALIRAIWTGERDDAIGARLRAACRDSVRRARREIADILAAYGDEIMSDEYA